MGGMGNMMSAASYSSSSGGNGGYSKQVSTQTVMRNGQQVTKRITVTRHPDGREERKEEELYNDQPREQASRRIRH